MKFTSVCIEGVQAGYLWMTVKKHILNVFITKADCQMHGHSSFGENQLINIEIEPELRCVTCASPV